MAAGERLICASNDLIEAGTGVRFEVDLAGETAPAFAVRFQGRVHGYLNRCAHVPVEMDFQPGEFFDYSRLYLICTVHGALYDPVDGRCLLGRCHNQGLVPVPLEEREGAVYYTEGGYGGRI
ncbi:MAG: Rieske 2Fe-2S domain-containing protein [Hydrogenophilales bacterium]|nr:Rieske 2Fe-2S domain-containing protein [Hydrogenophilales bacterium]